MLADTDRVKGLTADGDELSVYLNECKVFKEIMERKVFEQEVVIKVVVGLWSSWKGG